MKKFLLGILVGVVLTGLAGVVFVFALWRAGQARPSIPDNAVLVLRLNGEMPEAAPIELPLPFFESRTPATVTDNWDLLRRAASDSRIKALVLAPEGTQAGWGKLREIRDGLVAFRKSGKPLYAYLRAPKARDYYLATAAERIYMAPEDLLDVKGMRIEAMYFKNTLDKLGVDVQIEHAGKYKDAGDIATRTSMSPETREVMNSVLDGLYGDLVGAIASGRRQSPEQVRATIDRGPFLARDAAKAGFVDKLVYQDQMYDELKGRLKLETLRRVSQTDYLRARQDALGSASGKRVAFVVADGAIVRGEGQGGFLSEESVGAESFTRLLRRVREDNNIRAAIIRIDSPGGDAFASDEIWREMNLLSKRKPVVISMSDLAASGGYYIAMTGDPVLAYPGTLTGSIGVLFGKANLRGLYDKLGVSKDILTRGRFAAIDSDYTALTPEGKQKLRESIDAFYTAFVSRVAQGRKRQYEQVEPLAQGRVWLGSQAKQNGLVDELGGIDRAIELVKQRAGIGKDEKVRLVMYPPKRSLLDQLFTPAHESAFEASLRATLKRAGASAWLQGGILRIMPYSITVE